MEVRERRAKDEVSHVLYDGKTFYFREVEVRNGYCLARFLPCPI